MNTLLSASIIEKICIELKNTLQALTFEANDMKSGFFTTIFGISLSSLFAHDPLLEEFLESAPNTLKPWEVANPILSPAETAEIANSSIFSFMKFNKKKAPEKALLAPARPATSIKKDKRGAPKISGSYLYWQTKSEGLEFASVTTVPESSEGFTRQKIDSPQFAYKPGLKIGMGYDLPHDGWDLSCLWTYWNGEMSSNKSFSETVDPDSTSEQSGIDPFWNFPFFPSLTQVAKPTLRYSTAAASWNSNLNAIDLEMGRAFFITGSLPIRLGIGGKATWINQHYNVSYFQGTPTVFPTYFPVAVRETLDSHLTSFQHSWGIGPKTSLQSNWPIGAGFSFKADTAFSLLYAFYKTKVRFSNMEDVAEIPALFDLFAKTKENLSSLAPIFEAKLGLDWGYSFGSKNPIALLISTAYEWQYFWNQTRIKKTYTTLSQGALFNTKGALEVQGLTLTLGLDF